MKYKGLDVYENTPKGDVIASEFKAKKAIKQKNLIMIGQGKTTYWVIQEN